MKPRRTGLGIAAAIALALASPVAAAQAAKSFVPPGNSAANQYTEPVPTAGGGKEVGEGGGKGRAPDKVLGSRNAHRLEAQGQPGREAAALAAATAPSVIAPTDENRAGALAPPSGGAGGGGSSGKPQSQQAQGGPAELPSGSSGLGEVIGQATGSSSSGQLGLLLPLAIAAAIIWALAFFWRQRREAG